MFSGFRDFLLREDAALSNAANLRQDLHKKPGLRSTSSNRPAYLIKQRLPPIPLDKYDLKVADAATAQKISGSRMVAQRYELLKHNSDDNHANITVRAPGRYPKNITVKLPVYLKQARKKIVALGYPPDEPITFDQIGIGKALNTLRTTGKASIYPYGHYHALTHDPNEELYLQHEEEIEKTIQDALRSVGWRAGGDEKIHNELVSAARDRIIKNSNGNINGKTIADRDFQMIHAVTAMRNWLTNQRRRKNDPTTWTPEKLSQMPIYDDEGNPTQGEQK